MLNLGFIAETAAATVANSAGANAPAGGNSWVSTLILVVVMVAVFYFLIIRPQKKRDKQAKDMREAIKVGDEIVTIGGFVFRVISVKDDHYIVESPADHSKNKVMKWALSSVNTIHDTTPAK
jgi:preprotein translocase subunit YajC